MLGVAVLLFVFMMKYKENAAGTAGFDELKELLEKEKVVF